MVMAGKLQFGPRSAEAPSAADSFELGLSYCNQVRATNCFKNLFARLLEGALLPLLNRRLFESTLALYGPGALQDPKSWKSEHGGDEFEHAFMLQLFLGHDERGDLIPARQLREKYLQPRKDIEPPPGEDTAQD